MSTLTLVRHGQASYMQVDYDRLSERGEEQARLLGEYWVRLKRKWTRVFTGPSRRHRHTCELIGESYRRAGLPWEDPTVLPDMDEFDAYKVLTTLLPLVIEIDPEVRRMHDEFRAAENTPEAGRLLQPLFEEVARHWANGELHTPEVETWANFRARVSRTLENLRREAERNSSILICTSGGPVAAALSVALDLAPERALALIWTARNSSYSEFLFSGARFSLSCYNAIPHLEKPELLTYR